MCMSDYFCVTDCSPELSLPSPYRVDEAAVFSKESQKNKSPDEMTAVNLPYGSVTALEWIC